MSYLFASIHFTIIKTGILYTPEYISKGVDKKFELLHSIWYAKLVRRTISFLIRTPFRRTILKLIKLKIPVPEDKGCVFITCHSPWKRLIAQWCLEYRFALIIGGGRWTDKRRIIQRQGWGITELREIVNHLQKGGRIIVRAELFNNLNNCPVKFLGKQYNANVFAERLAILTKVPIIVVTPRLLNTGIEFTAGPQFSTDDSIAQPDVIATRIISYFEREIEANPAILAKYV